MKILFGTTNMAKFHTMEKITTPLGLTLISLRSLNCEIPQVTETGRTPLENAKIKANAYYRAFHMPIFSCDSGLYFDELNEEEQPGIHVRRVHGKELNDDEMISYYASLAEQHGGKLTGRYRNAICLMLNEDIIYSSMDISLATEPFILVSKPHRKRVKGFPLDSLSKDMKTKKYYYDLKDKDVASSALEDGFKAFFENIRELR